MLLDTYQQKGLLTVTLVNGQTSDVGVYAYRGDVVLIEGEKCDSSSNPNDRKPPVALLIHAAMIVQDDQIQFINGLLPTLNLLPVLVEKYGADFADDCVAILYIENIGKGMQVNLGGVKFMLLPYKEGLVWNELLEALYIEKHELKGQSAEDKVAIAYAAAKGFNPKSPEVSFAEAEANTIEVVKDAAVGAV